MMFAFVGCTVEPTIAKEKIPESLKEWRSKGETKQFNGLDIFVRASGPESDDGTYCMLFNRLWKAGGDDDFDDINATFLQPFFAYTLPSATTLSINTESTYVWTHDEWTVPVNLMMSQLVKIGNQPVQFQFGGRHYFDSPSGGPEWGVRFTLTLLFP